MNIYEQCLTPWAMIINQFAEHGCAELYLADLPTGATFAEYYPYFLKTCLLEFPFYYFFLRGHLSFKKILWAGVLLNVATHPIVFMTMPFIFSKFSISYYNYLAIAETFAPLTEALLLRFAFKVNWKVSFIAAILANLFSWTVGVFIT